jgi:hypothetical protein
MKIYIINAGRPWERWLSGPELQDRGVIMSQEIQRPEDLKKPSLYEGAEAVLALVHGVDESAARDFVDAWHALGEVRTRAWWLFYNGSGYRRADCGNAQIHFLRFDIGYEQIWSDERRRLIDFILAIDDSVTGDPLDTFKRLYPGDNVALASFLALLCAGQYVDIEPETAALREDEQSLRQVYDQFMLIRGDATKAERFALWKTDLRQQRYGDLARRISAVLGQVPD